MMMDGFLGDTVLVNGQPGYVLSAGTRAIVSGFSMARIHGHTSWHGMIERRLS